MQRYILGKNIGDELRILVISRVEWDESNSFGNTYSTLFRGMENTYLANVYCSYGKPNTEIAERFFCINEKKIIRSIFNTDEPSGYEVFIEKEKFSDDLLKPKYYETSQRIRWQILYWIRDIIWKTGKWKSKELLQFIDDFKPDIIFSPFYYSLYMNDVRLYIFKHLNVPMVSFVSDDIYTMKQFNISPLFWFNRLMIRRKVRKIAEVSQFLYVISDLQKVVYTKLLHPDCRLLYKGADFNKEPFTKELGDPLTMVFTGNISAGRWRTLSRIGKTIRKLNMEGQTLKLRIYTMTPLTNKMKKALNIPDAIELNGPVSADKIEEIQTQADILLHCESFNLKERLEVRLSFSTKIVDYFSRKRCIFAVGSKECASISYLIENDAAVVATTKKEIGDKLNELILNKTMILEYAEKSWECGKRKHHIDDIQGRLYQDLKLLAEEDKGNNANGCYIDILDSL